MKLTSEIYRLVDKLAKNKPYLTFRGELWNILWDNFGEKWETLACDKGVWPNYGLLSVIIIIFIMITGGLIPWRASFQNKDSLCMYQDPHYKYKTLHHILMMEIYMLVSWHIHIENRYIILKLVHNWYISTRKPDHKISLSKESIALDIFANV